MAEQTRDLEGVDSLREPWNDEAGLVEQAKTQPEAFGRLDDRYHSIILNQIYRRKLDAALTEDPTFNTFLNAMRARERYKNQGRFAA